jgi:hypothetical protein
MCISGKKCIGSFDCRTLRYEKELGADGSIKMGVSGTVCEGIKWFKLVHNRVKQLGFSEHNNPSRVT